MVPIYLQANQPGDINLGEMGKMRKQKDTAQRTG